MGFLRNEEFNPTDHIDPEMQEILVSEINDEPESVTAGEYQGVGRDSYTESVQYHSVLNANQINQCLAVDFRCVDLLSSVIASLDLRVVDNEGNIIREGDGRNFSVAQAVYWNRLFSQCRRPDGENDVFTFIQMGMFHLLTKGNIITHTDSDRNGNDLVRFAQLANESLSPDNRFVTLLPIEGGAPYQRLRINCRLIRLPYTANARSIYFSNATTAQRMVQGFVVGAAPIDVLKDLFITLCEVDADILKTVRTSDKSDVVIFLPPDAQGDPAVRKNYRAWIRGWAQKGDGLLLDSDAKVEQVGTSKDKLLDSKLKTKAVAETNVATARGVPIFYVNINADKMSARVDETARLFIATTIIPLAKKISTALSALLLEDTDMCFEFQYEDAEVYKLITQQIQIQQMNRGNNGDTNETGS